MLVTQFTQFRIYLLLFAINSNDAECRSTSQRLTVVYRADVSIPSFAEFLKSAVVKAGASARLQCNVDCQPKPAKITWYVLILYSAGSVLFVDVLLRSICSQDYTVA